MIHSKATRHRDNRTLREGLRIQRPSLHATDSEYNDEQRNETHSKMAEAGVTCNVHYKPLPAFTAYKNMGFDIKDFEYSLCRYQKQITLPLHTRLGYEDVMYVRT